MSQIFKNFTTRDWALLSVTVFAAAAVAYFCWNVYTPAYNYPIKQQVENSKKQ